MAVLHQMTEPTDERYFERIEEHFSRRRGGPLVLSPKDWRLVEEWQKRGIPVAVVLRGINQAFDRFEASGPRPDRINSLRYCAQEVEGAWEEDRASRARRAGSDTGGGGGLPGAAHLRAVATCCRRAAGGDVGPLRLVLENTAAQLDALAEQAEQGGLDARAVDQQAVALQAELVEAAAAAATDLGPLDLPSFSPYGV